MQQAHPLTKARAYYLINVQPQFIWEESSWEESSWNRSEKYCVYALRTRQRDRRFHGTFLEEHSSMRTFLHIELNK